MCQFFLKQEQIITPDNKTGKFLLIVQAYRREAAQGKRLLLFCDQENGPHINAQDVDGRPAMFEFLDDPDCLEILISHGARPDLLHSSGRVCSNIPVHKTRAQH